MNASQTGAGCLDSNKTRQQRCTAPDGPTHRASKIGAGAVYALCRFAGLVPLSGSTPEQTTNPIQTL